jgi:hypothetical protein
MSVLSFIIQAKDQASTVLGKVKNAVSGMGSAFSGITGQIGAALSVGAVVAFAKSVISYAGQIKDASAATGLATDKFQALAMAAKQNGVGMDQLSMAVGRLRNLQGSIANEKGVQDTFRKIGLSTNEVRQARPDELLLKIAQGVKRTGDASAAFDIFGRSASRLMTTLEELAGGWDGLLAKTQKGIISDRDIEAIDKMGDVLDTLGIKVKAASATFAMGAVDMFTYLGDIGGGFTPAEAMKRQTDRMSKEAAERREKEAAGGLGAVTTPENPELIAAQKEGATQNAQWVRESISEKQQEIRLQEQLNELVEAANEDGLTALERQIRMNAAMKTTLDLSAVQKSLKAKEAEEAKRLQDKEDETRKTRKERLVAENQYKYHAAYDRMTPEQQLAQTEKNIATWRKRRNEAPDEKAKSEASTNLIAQLQERDRIRKDAEAVVKDQAKTKNEWHDLSTGDLFARMNKQHQKKDPAEENVAVSKRILEALNRIEKKPGGMAP